MSGAVETSTAQLIEGPAEERRPSVAGRILNSWLLRRILKALLTIFIVTTGTFFLVRLLPGNPVDSFIHTQIAQTCVSYEAPAAQAKNLFSLDPEQPLLQQYGTYMVNL